MQYIEPYSICDTKRTWILDDSTVVKGTLLIILTVTGAASLRNASTIEPKAVLIRRFVPEVALILTEDTSSKKVEYLLLGRRTCLFRLRHSEEWGSGFDCDDVVLSFVNWRRKGYLFEVR